MLRDPALRDGEMRLLESVSAWDGNWTSEGCLIWMCTGQSGEHRLVAVNYSQHQSQCYVRLPGVGANVVRFQDVMGSFAFDRDGGNLVKSGLYVDMSPWGHHVFEMNTGPTEPSLNAEPATVGGQRRPETVDTTRTNSRAQ